jgi:hypothetical protein
LVARVGRIGMGTVCHAGTPKAIAKVC